MDGLNKVLVLIKDTLGQNYTLPIAIVGIVSIVILSRNVGKYFKMERKGRHFLRVPKPHSGTKNNVTSFNVRYVKEMNFGDDQRYRVADTTKFPHSSIAHMEMTFEYRDWLWPYLQTYYGTGFLAEGDKFLTAAHNVLDLEDGGGKVKSVKIYFGRDADSRKGIFDSINFRSRKDLSRTKFPPIIVDGKQFSIPSDHEEAVDNFDIAVADLSRFKEDLPKKCFKIDESNSVFNKIDCMISGYPGDKKPHGSQWQASYKVDSYDQRLGYKGVTYEGNSGSPVFRVDENFNGLVSGIHVGGDKGLGRNIAVLIRNHITLIYGRQTLAEANCIIPNNVSNVHPNASSTTYASEETGRKDLQTCTVFGIPEEIWDPFVEFVNELLVEHPDSRVDTLLALKLGSLTYNAYEAWSVSPLNIGRPQHEKVNHLLTDWRDKKKFGSLQDMVIAFDKILKKEPSFNMMNEKIRIRYLEGHNN